MHAEWALALAVAVVINEVLYDPSGPDGGNEFVELMNTGDTAVPVASLSLEVGDGARGSFVRVWQGTNGVLAPGAFWLVGGDAVVDRDGTLGAALQNGPDAVRLGCGDRIADLVGYGDLQDPALFETQPAQDVSALALARSPDGHDTDNNASDFVGLAPTPRRRNVALRNQRLRLDPVLPERLWPLRRLQFAGVVHNQGLLSLPAVSLRASIRKLASEPYVDGMQFAWLRPLPLEWPERSLAVGDSIRFGFDWNAERGLFLLAVQAFPADDDSLDDRDTLILRVGSGPVVMNEILFAPPPGEQEWIELWNRDARPHDLTGWTLTDASGRSGRLRGHTQLPPDSYTLLLADTLAAAPATSRLAASPWPSLNNHDDEHGVADVLVLRDGLGIVQDALFYSAAHVASGRSIERLAPDADVRGLLWSVSKDPSGASPGRPNSVRAPAGPEAQVTLAPNPFSPDGDGQEDTVLIQFVVPADYVGFRLTVFDLEGRTRAELGGDRLGPGPRRLFWDGVDRNGDIVATGIYLVHFELVGGAPRQWSRVVGVVRR